MGSIVLEKLRSYYPQVAMGLELSRMEFLAEFDLLAPELSAQKIPIVFLEAEDDILVRQHAASRRPHPLQERGNSLLEAIRLERQMLAPVRLQSSHTLNTGVLSSQQLHECLERIALKNERPPLAVTLSSFGFKYGLPIDANLVFDIRFLPNPYYISTLRPLTGQDPPIQDFLFNKPITQTTYQHILNSLNHFLPLYTQERRPWVQVAIGCTGGQHRSVAFVERLAAALQPPSNTSSYRVRVEHRHLKRSQAEIAEREAEFTEGGNQSGQS